MFYFKVTKNLNQLGSINMPIVSICIPTKDRLELLKRAVNSIIGDGVLKQKYEVVISDNSDGHDIELFCNELRVQGYNIKHVRNPLRGFYNSIVALENGNGALLKLHNDYSSFLPGQFSKMVDMIENHLKDKPTIFFSNGTLKVDNAFFSSKNDFISATHFQNTWSSAFSIWKHDFEMTAHKHEDVNAMFPHTSLLLAVNKKSYFICNEVFFENNAVAGKGGYNLFDCFCNNYLGMLHNECIKGVINNNTYTKVKWVMFIRFIIPWYYKTVFTEQGYTYIVDDADKIINNKYGFAGLIFTKIVCWIKFRLSKDSK